MLTIAGLAEVTMTAIVAVITGSVGARTVITGSMVARTEIMGTIARDIIRR
ncbi:MAG: hypothetical protein ACQESR_27305 [Planctomycetota bacterium]